MLSKTNGLAAVAALAALALTPASSHAATTVLAKPGGLSSGSCATAATACNIVRAVETVAQAGDTVELASGTYSVGSTLDVKNQSQTIVGAPGARPLIAFPATVTNSVGVSAQVANFHMRHVDVRAIGDGTEALSVYSGTFDDVTIAAPGTQGTAVFTGNGATFTNSTLVAGSNGDGFWSNGGQSEVRNVTIWSGGAGAYSAGVDKPVTRFHNSIVHGTGGDATLQSGGTAATAVKMTFDHSSYRPATVTRTPTFAAVSDDGGNQASAPLLANPGAGDMHQLAGSPTIDAGSHEAADGTQDFDGEARVQGPGTDIGADEFTVAQRSPGSTFQNSSGVLPAPVLGKLKLSPASFLPVASKHKTKKAKPSVVARGGTRITYRDSEAATTRFTVQRRTVVRRHGKRRVRWISVRGSFSHTDHPGANSVRFTGRLRGHALRPGRYRVVGVARNTAHVKSGVRRAAFRILASS